MLSRDAAAIIDMLLIFAADITLLMLIMLLSLLLIITPFSLSLILFSFAMLMRCRHDVISADYFIS